MLHQREATGPFPMTPATILLVSASGGESGNRSEFFFVIFSGSQVSDQRVGPKQLMPHTSIRNLVRSIALSGMQVAPWQNRSQGGPILSPIADTDWWFFHEVALDCMVPIMERDNDINGEDTMHAGIFAIGARAVAQADQLVASFADCKTDEVKPPDSTAVGFDVTTAMRFLILVGETGNAQRMEHAASVTRLTGDVTLCASRVGKCDLLFIIVDAEADEKSGGSCETVVLQIIQALGRTTPARSCATIGIWIGNNQTASSSVMTDLAGLCRPYFAVVDDSAPGNVYRGPNRLSDVVGLIRGVTDPMFCLGCVGYNVANFRYLADHAGSSQFCVAHGRYRSCLAASECVIAVANSSKVPLCEATAVYMSTRDGRDMTLHLLNEMWIQVRENMTARADFVACQSLFEEETGLVLTLWWY